MRPLGTFWSNLSNLSWETVTVTKIVVSISGMYTPYNVGSVLWRFFSTLEVVQYIGGITSVLWGIASVLWRLFSTVGDSFSTVGDNFSTVEVV